MAVHMECTPNLVCVSENNKSNNREENAYRLKSADKKDIPCP